MPLTSHTQNSEGDRRPVADYRLDGSTLGAGGQMENLQRGDSMPKAKKRGKQAGSQKKTSKRKRQREISPQTEQPFEQDSKRRIGQFGGAGEPPMMKK